ncbi:MAG: D-2-hydroxyacid dehydrogenase [Oscillospiraceae bacterium]|nr:D-2-hydroxyacid dehydrogenase [Oscillospiraceae bacterium]
MKKILIALPIEENQRPWLEEQAAGGEACSFLYRTPDGVVPADMEGVQAVIGTISRKPIAAARDLEWLQLSWAGADLFTAPGLLADNVILTNASGAYGLAVAEHMLATTLALMKRLHQYGRQQDAHVWELLGMVSSLEDATVLVLGLGDIGRYYARMANALGAHVIGVKRTPGEKPDYVKELYTLDALDAQLGRADVVAMVLPGGAQTEHIMDERRLRLMKQGAFLINDGRGGAIDPAGLKRVLADRLLGGVALDVTEPEPLPADDPLWDDPRVIITPHCSGKFLLPQTLERVVKLCGENLRRYTHGEPLLHIVNRQIGY